MFTEYLSAQQMPRHLLGTVEWCLHELTLHHRHQPKVLSILAPGYMVERQMANECGQIS
jgi:hypothetical protein